MSQFLLFVRSCLSLSHDHPLTESFCLQLHTFSVRPKKTTLTCSVCCLTYTVIPFRGEKENLPLFFLLNHIKHKVAQAFITLSWPLSGSLVHRLLATPEVNFGCEFWIVFKHRSQPRVQNYSDKINNQGASLGANSPKWSCYCCLTPFLFKKYEKAVLNYSLSWVTHFRIRE